MLCFCHSKMLYICCLEYGNATFLVRDSRLWKRFERTSRFGISYSWGLCKSSFCFWWLIRKLGSMTGRKFRSKAWTSQVIVLIRCGWAYSRREYEAKKNISREMVGKRRHHEENWKVLKGNQEKRAPQFLWKRGKPSGRLLVFIVPLGLSVTLHQLEEACERLYSS